jgi:hypothetical protein
MATLTIDDTQDAILEYLDNEIGVTVAEHAIPSLQSLPRDVTGKIVPYVAVQFGDLIPVPRGEGFAGPLFDDYRLPLYFQAVAHSAEEARRLANFVTGIFLGQTFPFGGDVRKRVGGSMFPLENNNGGVEAYIAPLSFSLLVQIAHE